MILGVASAPTRCGPPWSGGRPRADSRVRDRWRRRRTAHGVRPLWTWRPRRLGRRPGCGRCLLQSTSDLRRRRSHTWAAGRARCASRA